jgi:hypothetical protein
MPQAWAALNTFRLFSNYAERMNKTQEEILTFNNAWGLSRNSIFKKIEWWLKYWPSMNILPLFCYFKKFVCSLRIWRVRITAKNKGKLSTSVNKVHREKKL